MQDLGYPPYGSADRVCGVLVGSRSLALDHNVFLSLLSCIYTYIYIDICKSFHYSAHSYFAYY